MPAQTLAHGALHLGGAPGDVPDLELVQLASIEQAIERAGTKAGNKGAEAALSAIEMVNLLRKLES